MNNRRLCSYFLVKLSLLAVLLAGMFSQVKADTLYGPLRSGETLSSIVNQNYLTSPYDDAVIMREILRMNPQAFISNNMGLIRQGVMLTLPSDATVRRSQQGNSARVIQSVPRASSASTRALEATLSQVRGERDQANLRIRRIESESAAQVEALNSRVNRLESDKRTVDEQLTTSSAELAELQQSVKDLKQENSQLTATKPVEAAVVIATDDKTLKQFEQSEVLVAQKQQQITDLSSSVSALNKKVGNLKASHQVTISDLQGANQALKENLASQSQEASVSSNSTKQAEATIAALNLQHQKALDDLNTSFNAQLAGKDGSQVTLSAQIEDLKADSKSQASLITKLSNEKIELSEALSISNASLEELSVESTSAQEQVITDLGTVDSIQTVDRDPLISGPLTKQLLIQEIKKPVAFPLWGLLIGAFALGFTSLMLLFTRNRKQVVPVIADTVTAPKLYAAEDGRIEPLVSYRGDPSAQDPDVETLRVPPRRDPSRVAIMDPTMAATTAVAAAAIAASAAVQVDAQDTSAPTVALTTDPIISDSQQFDSKLKLLIAEAYEELGDAPAAVELLSEVSKEGNQGQITQATKLITQLNH